MKLSMTFYYDEHSHRLQVAMKNTLNSYLITTFMLKNSPLQKTLLFFASLTPTTNIKACVIIIYIAPAHSSTQLNITYVNIAYNSMNNCIIFSIYNQNTELTLLRTKYPSISPLNTDNKIAYTQILAKVVK